MAISVSCMACGKAYRVPEDRAGRKVRCQCGEAIFVPTSEDDDWEAHESSEDDLLVSPSQRRMEAKPPVPTKLPARVKPPVPPKSPTRSTTESSSPERQSPDAHQKAEEQRSGARNFGLSMAGTGIALLVLPLFGVQLRRAGNLGPQGAMIVGGVLFAIGAISFASASLIRVKPARKRRVSRRSAAAHAADAIDDDPEADDAEIVNPGERAAKIVLWAIIIVMLAVPGLLFGLPLLLLILFAAVIYWWIGIPLVLGVVALAIYWRRRRKGSDHGHEDHGHEDD